MYVAKQFQNHNAEEIKDFIMHNGFAILVTQLDGKLLGTHIPLHLSEDGGTLHGHIAKANPQWKSFVNDTEVLAIFSGPHAYISSSWYSHENVPTWNYIAVHVYGKIKIIEGEALRESLKRLVDKYEVHSRQPVSVEGMSSEYIEREMRGIVGFEITITSTEASYKLSQNRDRESYQSVIHELKQRDDEGSIKVAEEMQKNYPSIKKK